MLYITSIISLIFNRTFTIWFLIEINNFLFLCLISISIKNKKIIFLYFFTQMAASLLFLFGLLWQLIIFYFNIPLLIPSIIIFISLILKLGAPPFHFWLPLLSIYLKWNMIFLLFFIQKIIPFIILSFQNFPFTFYSPIIILCIIIPPFMIFNRTNIKKLLAYASINQIGWMLILIFQCLITWISYIILYSLSLFLLINSIKIWKINELFNSINSLPNKLLNIIIIINISGLPPLSFFIIKWYSILLLISQRPNNKIILLIILLRSIVILYLYINIAIKLSFPLERSSKLSTPTYFIIPSLLTKLLILSLIYSFLIITI